MSIPDLQPIRPQPTVTAPTDARRTGTAAALLAGASLWGLFAVGITPEPLAWPYLAAVAALTLFLFDRARRGSTWAMRFSTSLLAVALTGIGSDLLLRATTLGDRIRYYRDHERLVRRWPPLPVLTRYRPLARFEGRVYGDLAALEGDPSLREYRFVRFVVDEHGFRNEPSTTSHEVVVLGDSIAAGNGTTQEATFSARLASDYGMSVYNAAIPAGPWEEYLNLMLESEWLIPRPGIVLVWALFAGNDLWGPFGPTRREELPWNTRVGESRVIFETFRLQSPLRKTLARAVAAVERHPSNQQTLLRRLPDGSPFLLHTLYLPTRKTTADIVRQYPNYPAFVGTLEAMRELAAQRRIKVLACVFPAKEQVYAFFETGPGETPATIPTGFADVVGEFATHAGWDFLDLTRPMTEEAQLAWQEKGELLWWRDDTHLNPAGHAVAAKLLAPRVRNLLAARDSVPAVPRPSP